MPFYSKRYRNKPVDNSKTAKKSQKLPCIPPSLWITLWIKWQKSVDNFVDNFFQKNSKKLSTVYPQVYPQAILMIINRKIDLSTDFRALNNNMYTFK
jgi:hypothetical protein